MGSVSGSCVKDTLRRRSQITIEKMSEHFGFGSTPDVCQLTPTPERRGRRLVRVQVGTNRFLKNEGDHGPEGDVQVLRRTGTVTNDFRNRGTGVRPPG